MLQKYKELLIRHASGRHGMSWLGLLSITESIFLPIPTDSLMMGMLLIGDNRKRWVYIATVTMVTSVIGAVIGYFIAFFLFDSFGNWLIDMMHAREEFGSVHKFLNHGAFIFTFIGAVSPIPYKLFVLTAGFVKINFVVFLVASIMGRSLRLYFSAWLVYKYGEKSIKLANRYGLHLAIIGVVLFIVYILGYMWL